MRIAIVTAVWKRPEVFQFFAQGVRDLQKAFPRIRFIVFVAGSEGEESRQLVLDAGMGRRTIYVEVPNDPLGRKHNAAARAAKSFNPNFTLCLGSDDIVSPAAFQVYLDHIAKEPDVDFIGTSDLYFYDSVEDRAAYWSGYTGLRRGHATGAGILLSRRIMKIWGWRPWDGKLQKGLDASVHAKLRITHPHKKHIFSLAEHSVVSVDIKSDDSKTPFELWDNTQFINQETITNVFPFIERR